MKKIIILILLVASIKANAQQVLRYSGSFSNAPIETIIKAIETDLNIKFYYRATWVDSLSYSGSFNEVALNQALTTIFDSTPIKFFIDKRKVYLTNDLLIIDNLQIISSIVPSNADSINATEASESPDLLFTREYRSKKEDENDLEDYVFEIGNRSLFKAGQNATVAGFIRNNETNEPIEGAVIYTPDGSRSALSSADGFYSITLPNGQNRLFIQYTGMKLTRRQLVVFSNGKLDVGMDVDVIALNEVIVEAERRQNIESLSLGIEKLTIEQAKVVPVVLGERDILKVATTFAGVQTLGEGAAGFNVRGGKSDQNLFLLDGATVYNASHFMGFFSVFNSDALDGMDVIKTGIPPKFGGRLASVFDISSKSANKDNFAAEGGISPITSRLTLEVPIIKEKSSLLISGRTTYSNWVLDLVDNAEFRGNEVAFSDLITKYDHDLGENDNLSISAYISSDDFRLNSDTLFSFSDFSHFNLIGSANWSHRFNENLDANFSASFSKYGYEFESTQSAPNAFLQDFGIEEYGAKANFNYDLSENSLLNFGAETKRYIVNPGSRSPLGTESLVQSKTLDEEQGQESAVFLSNQYTINPKLSIEAGFRYSLYSAIGPGTEFVYLEGAPLNGESVVDNITYDKGEVIKTYHGAELRLSGRYLLDDYSSVKLGYSRNRQYIHSLLNTASISPTDIWRLSNTYIKPQISDEISVGYFRDFNDGEIETSIEAYGKRLRNLLDFKTGADFLLNGAVETIALQGPGRAYGIELSVKKSGRLNGWFNYAYARSFLKLEGNFREETINDGEFFPTNYDMPHTINLVSNYDVTKRFSISYNFTYNSGRPVTTPVGRYTVRGVDLVSYSDRNAFRIPDYVRMDIGFTLKWGHRTEKLTKSFWSFSIYNVLGRDNPFSIFFDLEDGRVQGYTLTVFGAAIPTLSYNFKF